MTLHDDLTRHVLGEVYAERDRQDARWGQQDHPDGTAGEAARGLSDKLREMCDAAEANGILTWTEILTEEVAESFAEARPATLRAELVQVAAVAVAWIEKIDREHGTVHPPAHDHAYWPVTNLRRPVDHDHDGIGAHRHE